MTLLRSTLALAFASAGLMKLVGKEEMVDAFRHWGYSDGFRLATGAGELAGAAMLLSPATARAGAAELGTMMAGATYTHLKTQGERKLAIVPLAVLSLLGWVAARTEDD